jgi:Tetratricopeptide repeat
VPALTATTGWAASEVDATLQRVRALAKQLDRPEQFELVILGQFMLRSVRSEHRVALELCKQIAQLGESRSDAGVQLISFQMQGVCHFQLGEFVAARVLLERAVDFDRLAHPALGALTVEPYVVRRIYLSLTLACLGYVDQARLLADEALLEARRIEHAFTLAFLLVHECWFGWITRTPSVLLEECLALTTAHGYRHFWGWAQAYYAQSLIECRRAQDSIPLLEQALSEMRACGSVINTPMLLTWLAQACTELGQIADAHNYLAEAATLIKTNDERLFEAELLHRVPGDLLNAVGNQAAAEQHYRRAIVVAERQNAKLFQLRASVSLARLWRDQGNREKARDLLRPIYNWFTEGFDAPDLKDGKALLDELA